MSRAIQVLDKSFVPYLGKDAIAAEVQRLANELKGQLGNKKPLFIAVLNGSFMFASDLFKQLDFDAEICFIKLASYKGTKSTGQVVSAIGLDVTLRDRHVVVLEDIVDTGRTLNHFLPELQNHQPASLSLCVLLHKPEATVFPIKIDYTGFSIPNRFVVGYGLDYDGYGRNLPEIYQLEMSDAT
ncbi:MAG: hypoxanthine phosphoribosyltransferase [Chitinophagaceae bacterium]|jgi:hypoxanthine phosphoribosyltransferase|nr:hypoxanthine phosphoribosyltransferase [Chitinophagaceae bacterium]